MNAFLLTKRLSIDYEELLKLAGDSTINTNFLQKSNEARENFIFPETNDFKGAIEAILRLQRTYNLDTEAMASGVLNKVDYGVKIPTSDCFEISRHAYDIQNYHLSNLWVKETLRQLESGNDSDPELSKLALDLQENLKLQDLNPVISENEHLDIACRGDLKKSPLEEAQLKCRYVTNNLPFLKIAPFKVEEVNLEPPILVFHDVISDDEIEKIKELAAPQVKSVLMKSPQFS